MLDSLCFGMYILEAAKTLDKPHDMKWSITIPPRELHSDQSLERAKDPFSAH